MHSAGWRPGAGPGNGELYTDDDEVLFAGRRPICLNGIEDVVNRADLVDRCEMLAHEPIPEKRRRDEKELEKAFKAAAPKILGALLDGLVAGLNEPRQRSTSPTSPGWPTLPCGPRPARGPTGRQGTFLECLSSQSGKLRGAGAGGEPGGRGGAAVHGPQDGVGGDGERAAAAADRLGGASMTAKEQGWPKRANILSGKLRRAAPALRKAGLHVAFERGGHASTRTIRIEARAEPEQAGESSSASSAPSAAAAEAQAITAI